MQRPLSALGLLAVATLAAGSTAQAQRAPCAVTYVVVAVNGVTRAPFGQIACARRAGEPLRLGDLTPAHSHDLSAQCSRACDTARLLAEDPAAQTTGGCDGFAPPPLYETTRVIEQRTAAGCQAPTGDMRAVQAPSFIAPVQALSAQSPRQVSPPVQARAPIVETGPAVHDPVRAPAHTMPAVARGSASRIPH